ncbi:MAG TPA: methyltransferase domain-containing protein [Burkholderiales bacterium]|nr:methyltransferase domain-containing protein [Burkholderiales bacterium]
MIRYGMAALAFKTFSLNDATKQAYRWLGNRFGAKRRQNADLDVYVRRGNLLVELYRKHAAPRPADRVLELGTGWMHWYAVYLRLFFDVRITTLDVWDNRQFAAFKSCFSRLRARMDREPVPPACRAALDGVLAAQSFEQAYAALGLNHVIVPDGSLAQFPHAAFGSVFSMHVLEHVQRDAVPRLVADLHRILRPGAITIHQIGIDDHLAHYDRTASRKQYLAYSDRLWAALFENDVQYFNRLQLSDWIRAFEQAGFVVLDTVAEKTDLRRLRISPAFSRYGHDDLACTIATLVLRRA